MSDPTGLDRIDTVMGEAIDLAAQASVDYLTALAIIIASRGE